MTTISCSKLRPQAGIDYRVKRGYCQADHVSELGFIILMGGEDYVGYIRNRVEEKRRVRKRGQRTPGGGGGPNKILIIRKEFQMAT